MKLFTFMNTWLWAGGRMTLFKQSIQGILSEDLFNSNLLNCTTTDPQEKEITQDTGAITN